MKITELLDPQNIMDTYTKLQQASAEYFLAETLHVQKQTEQRAWFAERLAEGVIVGKNETEREGNARMLNLGLYTAVEAAYGQMMAARSRMEVARLEERKISMIMRAADLYVHLYETGHKGLDGIYPPTIQSEGADSWVSPLEDSTTLPAG